MEDLKGLKHQLFVLVKECIVDSLVTIQLEEKQIIEGQLQKG